MTEVFFFETNLENTNLVISLCTSQISALLVCAWTTYRWLEQKENWDQCGQFDKKDIDLGDSTPLLNQNFLRGTQRDAVHHVADLPKADLFRRNTTTEETNEKQNNKKHKFLSDDHSMDT